MLVNLLSLAFSTPPHILSILQDDLGWHDSGINNPDAAAWSPNITQMAKSGIVLNRHYTHWHCSPSRRSFLTGRLPIHHGEQLSGDGGDDIDLRMAWISEKLLSAGYTCHMFGKWHTGFRSMAHLPASRGFAQSVGSLQTGGNYAGPKHSLRWQDDHPLVSDANFEHMPDGCDVYADGRDGTCADGTCEWQADMLVCADCATPAPPPQCAPAAAKNDTKLACGEALQKTAAGSAGDCCALCAATRGCTHWVFQEGDEKATRCHVKGGKAGCAEAQKGATAGVLAGPPTPPAPPATAECTDESVPRPSLLPEIDPRPTLLPAVAHHVRGVAAGTRPICGASSPCKRSSSTTRRGPSSSTSASRPCTRRTTRCPLGRPTSACTTECCGARTSTWARCTSCSSPRACGTTRSSCTRPTSDRRDPNPQLRARARA